MGEISQGPEARRFVAGGALDCAAEDRRNMSGQLESRGAVRRLSQALTPKTPQVRACSHPAAQQLLVWTS